MKGMIKRFKHQPKRLLITTILMAFLLLVIVLFIVGLLTEKSRIQFALDLSQYNREQLFRTERVTESVLMAEARFREYCTTFEKPVFEAYQNEVMQLARHIESLQQTFSEHPSGAAEKIAETFRAKTTEAQTYMKLRLITDSLIFFVEDLQENQAELETYIGDDSEPVIDTLSVTETTEVHKKGLLGKIKSAIVGETVRQNVETTLRVQTGNEADREQIRQEMIRALRANRLSANAPNFDELVRRTVELKESELKLIGINNHFIAQIRALVEGIKTGIREQEAAQNSFFLNTVKHSTGFFQNTLIILVVLACILGAYILWLVFRNDKFQQHIITLNEQITKDSMEKDKFYSIINHDIMNPFNTLLGYSQVLKDAVREGDREEMEESSALVHQSANRISNLLQNLLVWSRVQNGKMQYAPASCQINRLVSEVADIVRPIAKNKDIQLNVEVTGEIEAEIDRNMISSVLQNLTTNAIKFTEKGGEVTVSALTEPGQLHFTVSDTGVGIPEEQHQKLFSWTMPPLRAERRMRQAPAWDSSSQRNSLKNTRAGYGLKVHWEKEARSM